MRSLFAGVSGLKTHTTRMDVIGNNISNINTVGFKSSRVTFSDMLSQTSSAASAPTSTTGGINAKQIGLGAAVASVDMIFTDGSAQSTGKNTDITLSGNGLFVLKKGDDEYYTRNGAFEFDANGNYVLPGSGYYVQGWMPESFSSPSEESMTNINIEIGKAMNAEATTSVTYSGNLNANAPTITAISYTSGGGTANASLVTSNKTVAGITVSNAPNFTYDARVMTPTVTAQRVYTDETTGELTTETRTLTAADLTNGTLYVKGNAYTFGEDAETEYTITNINYSISDTVTPQEGDTVTLTLSNGTTVEGEAGTAYEIGAAYGDEAGVTITGVSVSYTTGEGDDATVTTTNYPAAVNYSANRRTSILYTDGSSEVLSSGSRTIGESVLSSVNVDGTNVISATLTLSDGTTQTVTSGFYERGHSVPVTTVVTVYDSRGESHAISVLMDKDTSSVDPSINSDALALAKVVDNNGNTLTNIDTLAYNSDTSDYTYTLTNGQSGTATASQVTWENRWRVFLAPGEGQNGAQSEVSSSEYHGYLNYNSDTELGALSYLYYDNSGAYSTAANSSGSSFYGVYDGADPSTAQLSFGSTSQYSGSTTIYSDSDGNAAGTLQTVEIDANGSVMGSYSNGIINEEARIAIAQFTNNAGLTKVGTSLYQASNNSGAVKYNTVSSLGLEITPSSLEMSNVELASELADMIVTQRGFQSNSKIMTVADEMLETVINMKR